MEPDFEGQKLSFESPRRSALYVGVLDLEMGSSVGSVIIHITSGSLLSLSFLPVIDV